MAALTYSTLLSTIANLLVVDVTSTTFLADFPNIVSDGELRIYRDLDLLNTVVTDASAQASTGTRTFNLPSTNGTFVVIEDINIITPFGTSNPDNGTRNSLVPATKETIDFLYPSSAGSTVPQYFGMVSQSTVVFGPWPDQAYQVEVVGTIRPNTLSSTTTTTLLSVYFPDLLVSACMVRGAAFLKSYGAASDDPKLAMSWDAHYGTELAAARTEENRKKFTEAGWSSKEPAPDATPPRT